MAAQSLAGQRGHGVSRATIVALGSQGGSGGAVTVLDGDPAVALLHGSPPGTDPVFASLTPRERDVAHLVSTGLRNAQIAAELVVTLATVKDHVHRILRKTGLPSRAAVATAWRG
jgi:DNA-binding NarL/FixJ family response regulator